MAWVKGQSGNPAGAKKRAFAESPDIFKIKKKAHEESIQIMSDEFAEIVYSMCELAKRGNVPAARFVAEYLLGKPKETVIHDITDEAKEGLKLAYKLGN